jgi:alpha-D-xyloside xylohydrolase
MRALFMDFPADERVVDIRDEYMFGPALLVAPVVEQGMTTRDVYLPAGSDWYNYWTNERLRGGQTVKVDAPIETIPLFVRAGSILPLGEPVESTHEKQALMKLKVYAGRDAEFALYDDDGITYEYEHGKHSITTLRWNDGRGRLTMEGAKASDKTEAELVEVVGR